MTTISFSGVDGSGKTTQRELLQKDLEESGNKVVYFHATEFSLVNRLSRRIRGKKNFTPGTEKAVASASFSSVLVRLCFLMIDAIRFEFYVNNLKKQGVTYILSDRFFQDSLINALYLSANPLIDTLATTLAPALPAPDTTFYLKLSLDDLITRDRVAEQGQQYLTDKINLYNNPPFDWHPVILDATDTPANIHQKVLMDIKKERSSL